MDMLRYGNTEESITVGKGTMMAIDAGFKTALFWGRIALTDRTIK
jgi:hypothetical protein